MNSEGESEIGKMCLIIFHPNDVWILLYKDGSRQKLSCGVFSGEIGLGFEEAAEWIPTVRGVYSISFDITVLRCAWYKLMQCSSMDFYVIKQLLF